MAIPVEKRTTITITYENKVNPYDNTYEFENVKNWDITASEYASISYFDKDGSNRMFYIRKDLIETVLVNWK